MKNFVAGLSLGIVAGLLLAPQRGEVVRADLRRRARRIFSSTSEVISRRRPSAKKSPESATGNKTTRKESAAEILNSATRDALIAVHGIGQVLADRIIASRPYEKAYDVVENGILPESTFAQLRRELLEKGA